MVAHCPSWKYVVSRMVHIITFVRRDSGPVRVSAIMVYAVLPPAAQRVMFGNASLSTRNAMTVTSDRRMCFSFSCVAVSIRFGVAEWGGYTRDWIGVRSPWKGWLV